MQLQDSSRAFGLRRRAGRSAFWRDDDSANPDREVLNAVRASMATFGSDAMVIAGSSPYARRGVLWDAFQALAWQG